MFNEIMILKAKVIQVVHYPKIKVYACQQRVLTMLNKIKKNQLAVIVIICINNKTKLKKHKKRVLVCLSHKTLDSCQSASIVC